MTQHPPPKRVIVFCLSGLGDAILSSPALAALASMPDRFQLTLLTMFPVVTEYLRDQQFTSDVRLERLLGMSKLSILHQARALRRERFDVSVLPYAMNRLGYNMFSRAVGARWRIGFRYARQSWINLPQLNQCVIDEDPVLHAVEENLCWLEILTGQRADSFPDELHYRIPEEAIGVADQFLRQHGISEAVPVIGIHASCNSLKNQHRRCWPATQFGTLIQRVCAKIPSARFVLFEGPADGEINRAVITASKPYEARIVVAQTLPMRVVGALVRRSHVFLSNDSGLMHTAAACQVPCVALFGPTNPVWVRPWKTQCVVMSRDLPCSPCFYYSSRPLGCPAGLDYACMRELPVEQVFDAVQNLLSQKYAKS